MQKERNNKQKLRELKTYNREKPMRPNVDSLKRSTLS